MADSDATPLSCDTLCWDIFCRVIDNFGDIGVCWRLAADLASRGHAVRLWVDDASALEWMAPDGRRGIDVRHWDEAARAQPAEVVIEAFGCDPPPAFVLRMAQRTGPRKAAPVWINLEYLSAEAEVERCHGLPSPQLSGPGAGLTKWFFYPGFTARTGGLIREPGLAERRPAFDATAWLQRQGLSRRPGERLVSLFCYPNPAVPALLAALSAQPTLLLSAPGAATEQVQQALATTPLARLRVAPLPWLTQFDFDHLLWSCDLNFVRGEDSFVRSQWAGAPFVWQIYAQHDAVHGDKVQAFLDRFLAQFDGAPDAALTASIDALWRCWNGLATADPARSGLHIPPLSKWRSACERWRAELNLQSDLCTQLIRFVAERR